ncbi:hypothetical protein SKAU_G00129410 [Synaphobranchus kaupii]|uniref:PiggyBac transposable element-derived protein domain-containing protein n=1 Tax=Synaphobranchus kaupii TaxID=118154 RepID=A0A9Q1FQS4_SYNKA|nr:hypothetical protein SKAU_G00129410 [Synaphobranchus kaupii]
MCCTRSFMPQVFQVQSDCRHVRFPRWLRGYRGSTSSQPAAQPAMARSACPPAKRRASAPAPSTTKPQDSWRCVTQPDTEPPQFSFCPVRIPGPQLDTTKSYSPLELFQLFFSESVEMYRYLSLVVYMGLLRVNNMATYWSRHRLYKLAFTESVMPRRRIEAITWTLHMSDPVEDAHNDRKRGSHGYDQLLRL